MGVGIAAVAIMLELVLLVVGTAVMGAWDLLASSLLVVLPLAVLIMLVRPREEPT